MRVAAIDIGTNSVLLLIAERREGVLQALTEHATITRLGQDVDATGKLAPEAIERTLACLQSYAGIIAEHDVASMAAVGTSAMRDAEGGEAFIAAAKELLGVAPQVISGMREAKLTFEGALTGLASDGAVAVFDVGGGSTEIITGRSAIGDGPAGDGVTGDGPHIEQAVSLDIGSVRLTERCLHQDPPTPEQLEAVRAEVRKALPAAPALSGRPLIGVAGTVTTLGAIVHKVSPYDGGALHGRSLSRQQIAEAIEMLAGMPLQERRALPYLSPKRADVIVAGSLLVDELCHYAQADEMTVSDRGVRWGLAQELCGETADNVPAKKGSGP